ncbi:hypothetical protein ACVRYP_07145 [Streptococcus rifensis]
MKQSNVLYDYEGLTGQISELTEIIDLAIMQDDKQIAHAVLNTLKYSLSHLADYHTKIVNEAYKEVSACKK